MQLNYFLFLFTLLVYCFNPTWYLPVPGIVKIAVLNIFFFAISLPIYFSNLKNYKISFKMRQFAKIQIVFPMIIVLLLHIPIWNSLIQIGGDEQSHSGPPAYLLAKLFPGISLYIYHLLFVIIVLLLIIYIANKTVLNKTMGDMRFLIAVLVFINLFAFFVIRFSMVDKIGKWETLLRYPPVGKFLYLIGYSIFGIHEWTPRFIQFVFIFLTALVFIKIIQTVREKSDSFIIVLITLLFPSFFYLSNSGELEAGTVFLYSIIAYFHIKALNDKDFNHVMHSCVFLAIGFFYKQLFLGLLLIIILHIIICLMIDKTNKGFYINYLKQLWIPLLCGMPLIILGVLYKIRDTGFVLTHLLNSELYIANLYTLFQVLGPVLSIFLVLSICHQINPKDVKNTATHFMLSLFLSYFVMITSTGYENGVGSVRHCQPFYIPLVLFLAVLFSDISMYIKKTRYKAYFYTCLSALFLYYGAIQSNSNQIINLTNYTSNAYPYPEVMGFIKQKKDSLVKIFAPMETEPSHFYLAKYNIAAKTIWDRDIYKSFQSSPIFLNFYDKGRFDYLLLPYTKYAGNDFKSIVDDLLFTRHFRAVKVFFRGGNTLIMMKRL